MLFGLTVAHGQSGENPNKAIKAVIVSAQAYIFKAPNFDADTITILEPSNKVYLVSKGKWGPFHKIKVDQKTYGYVIDADIKLVSDQTALPQKKSEVKQEPRAEQDDEDPKPEKKAFLSGKFFGPVVQMINFTEDTADKTRSQMIPFLGARWSGLSSLLEGAGYTDANLLFYWGAPSYYQSATGRSASGFIVIGDMLLEMMNMQGPDLVTFYGVGPMVKFSNISATLNESGTDRGYSMTDLILGAAFNVGAVTRIGKYALRFDAKYYWEKQKYWALGLAFQWESR